MEIIILLILVCIFFIVREMNSKQSLKSREALEQENRILGRILGARVKLQAPEDDGDDGPDGGLDEDGDGSDEGLSHRDGQRGVSSEAPRRPTAEREDPIHAVTDDGQDGMLVTVFTSGAVDLTRGRAAWCAYVRSKGAMSEPCGMIKTKVANALHAEVAAAAEGIKYAIEKLAMKAGDTVLLQSSSEYALLVLSGAEKVEPGAPESGIVFHIIDLLQQQRINLRTRHRGNGNGDRERRDRALQLVETRVQEMLVRSRKAPTRVKTWDSGEGETGEDESGTPVIVRQDLFDRTLGQTPEAASPSAPPLAGLAPPPPLPADAYPTLPSATGRSGSGEQRTARAGTARSSAGKARRRA